ncbi:MAG: GrpB family protein [Bacillaceae bacterium]|nr:GrpB family protein [Bacillaceae bacterium]
MRKVAVIPYNEDWKRMFIQEANKIKNIFEQEIIRIYHIGSTAIPGIHAKPIIDIMGEVISIEQVDLYNQEMKKLGYEAKRENGIQGRRFFIKGGDERTHHVHIYQTGKEEIERHLAFRDYMIAHPEEAEKYSELKQKLAKQFPDDIESYVEGKDAFVKEMNRKALQWKRSQAK